MTGTLRFDDEHIVKFVLDEENMNVYLTVILNGNEFSLTAPIEDLD